MYSVQRVVSDGTLQIVDLSITYFDRSEIAVYINSELYTDWQWASDVEDRILFNEPIPAGVEVLIKRTTDLSKLRHYFSKGSAFTAEALDEDLQQVLHIAQEATEASLSGDFYTDIDMHGYRVRNIGPAVDDSDALTLRQYKQDAQGAFVARNQAEQFKNEAASYASSAQTSANNSAASAQAAAAAVGSAQTYAANAAASASAAAQSATNAAASASDAAQSATNAAASFDAFDDRYLGAKPSDPATDNDGNALQVGALYWNTTANEMRVWNGSSWRVAVGSLVGNADTATKLQTARTINGTLFDGSADITTANWGTARTLTIGNTGKSVDGSANVSWSLAEVVGVGVPGTAQELVDGVDLNTIQTLGFYHQGLNVNAASGANYPMASAGALVVLRNAGGVSQLYYTYGSATTAPLAFFRTLYMGSWSTWREFYHSGNLNPNTYAPPGMVAYFARNTAPDGWLKANGAAVSRTAYAALFNAIGTTFGAGDGTTTFNLPDLRGEFLRGWDDGRGVDSGRGIGTFQGQDIQSHTHPQTGWTLQSGVNIQTDGAIWDARLLSAHTGAAGGAETRPRNVALLACNKY